MTLSSVSTSKNYLMWFRRDLRLHDNTALTMLCDSVTQALADNADKPDKTDFKFKIVAMYNITAEQWLEYDMSLVQMDFIFRTLKVLANSLFNELNITLHLIHSNKFDDSVDDIEQFCKDHDIGQVFTNIEYEVNEQNRDKALSCTLAKHNISFNRYHDQCILAPGSVKTNDDTLYKVFTPFYKKWQSIIDASPIQAYSIPSAVKKFTDNKDKNLLEALLNKINDFHQKTREQFITHYQLDKPTVDLLVANTNQDYPAGEHYAQRRLNTFINEDISNYDIARDTPALMATSQLSAYLALGSISTRQCYQKAKALLTQDDISNTDVERWISELAWRDFYRHVIVDRPDIVKGAAYKKKTDSKLNWSYDVNVFKAWCQGKTGVPIVDAAMRCLNQTGFMHNRMRMVTAMFLTKDLFVDWRWGEKYFMQKLIDGDFASNNGGWQWSASVGTDAAPYFRIMNPFSQAKTHDTEAIFIKTWLPELKSVPAKILHDEAKLRKALSDNGDFAHIDYPLPMVEHKKARLMAIEQFKK